MEIHNYINCGYEMMNNIYFSSTLLYIQGFVSVCTLCFLNQKKLLFGDMSIFSQLNFFFTWIILGAQVSLKPVGICKFGS